MLFIDIETVCDKKLLPIYTSNIKVPGNYKDEIKIKQYLEAKAAEAEMDMALDQDFSTINCIGILNVNTDDNSIICGPKIVSFTELVELLGTTHRICTFNGKAFDLPIIMKTAVKMGLDSSIFPYNFLRKGLNKYSDFEHLDLMVALSMGGAFKSQDTYMQVYLGKAKKPIDFATCTQEELENHCLEDCRLLFELYRKFKCLF